MNKKLVIIRGGGDLATGIVYILKQFDFDIIVLETSNPSAVRRTVALCEAVYENTQKVENLTGVLCNNLDDIHKVLKAGNIPVYIDAKCELIKDIKADILVDCIIAKKNLGTKIDMANIVIGVGPGFTAKKDVHCVIETARGHNVGRLVLNGQATKNTGIPGVIGGYSHERVHFAKNPGTIKTVMNIGDLVKVNDIIAYIDDTPIKAKISGVLRGLIKDGYKVKEHTKCADIDPRNIREHCFSISDKARMIGYGTLAAINYVSKGTI